MPRSGSESIFLSFDLDELGLDDSKISMKEWNIIQDSVRNSYDTSEVRDDLKEFIEYKLNLIRKEG